MAPPRKLKQTESAVLFATLADRAGIETEEHASEYLGIAKRTARHYRAGTRECPEPVIRLLRAIIKFDIEPDDLL
jgi:hypothetical protein